MREIKFRAFDTNAKVMSDVLSIWHNIDLSIAHVVIVINKEEPIEVDTLFNGFELMQFTGLKDKNGKEIYEGDILKWRCSKSGSRKEELHIVVISFGTHSYNLTIHHNKEKWATGKSYWNANDREVIGNIHENPELLNA